MTCSRSHSKDRGTGLLKSKAKLFPLGCFPATLILSEAPQMCQEIQVILKTCPPHPSEEPYLTGAQAPFIHKQESLETLTRAEIGPTTQI